jgi:hypothetical protein
MPVSVYKQVLKSSKGKSRDPRFDEHSGEFNKNKFYSTYGFIEKMKVAENKLVRINIKKAKTKKHAKKFTPEDRQEMLDHFANNKQDLGRLKQIKHEQYVKKEIKADILKETGHKLQFVNQGTPTPLKPPSPDQKENTRDPRAQEDSLSRKGWQ